MATADETQELRSKYEAGNFGYGHAKQALFELIKDKYDPMRKSYEDYMSDKKQIDHALKIGAEKANDVANDVLQRLRAKLGYKR